jgi:RNA-splicing ligase RtcB
MSAIKTFGPVDERSLKQLERCMEAGDAEFGVLCADHHPGYSQPIGGGIAYEGYVSPSGVGYDVACGTKAARTDLKRADLDALGGVEPLMREITRRISFGMGVPAQERVDHPVLDKIRNAEFRPQRKLAQLAESQLGTVGSGNHYVNLMEDEQGHIWVGVHFGSRGFGHKTASGFLALAVGKGFDERAREGEMDSPPVLFAVGSELGEAYISAMELAGAYAYAGRDVVVDKVLEILGGEAVHEVHNHHNFCIPASEKVQTPHGHCPIAELKAGDDVYAFDQRQGLCPTKVVDVWSTGRKQVYSIETDSRRLRCSADHPILTIEVRSNPHPDRPWHKKRQGRLVWKQAGEIRPGDLLACANVPCANGKAIGLDQARLVGAFLGDGWLRAKPLPTGYSVGLAIGTPGEAHTGRYLDLCKAVLPGRWRAGAPGHFGLSCSSKAAYEGVQALGVGARASEKRLPDYAFSLPRQEKLALLAGYFDADGSVANASTRNHGRGTIASTSGALVEGIRELAVRSGLRATPVRSELRTTNFRTARVYLSVIAASSMADLELWHDRKRALLRPSANRSGLRSSAIGYVDLPEGVFAQRVRRIRTAGVEDVYDLEVAHDSHSFVCEGVVLHNCSREEHFGRTYWVIRKGCTPARPGQEGFVGGSMGDESVILEGVESAENEQALYSTVHGAGRVMSRSQAAGRSRTIRVWACPARDCDFHLDARKSAGGSCPEHGRTLTKSRRLVQVKPGLVDWAAVQARLREQGIVLVGGGADEAPEVYKRLPEVLAAHGGTVRVKHRLRPLGVAMAGRDVYDPYKD